MLTPEDFLSVTQFHIVTDGSPFDIAVENLDAEFLELFAEEPWQRTRHVPDVRGFLINGVREYANLVSLESDADLSI